MRHVIRFLLRHRGAAIVFILISVAVAAWSARRIEVRFQFRDFYDYPQNAKMPLFRRYSEEFGDPAGFVVLLLEARDVLGHEVLEYVDAVTRDLEHAPMFKRVRSMTNTKLTYGEGDDVFSGPLMPSLPDPGPATERVRRVALASSLLRRRLISEDSTTTAVLAEMRTPATLATITEQREAIEAVKRTLARHPPPAGVRADVTGAPVAEVETTRTLTSDLLVFTPVAVLLIILALALTFRSAHGVVLPLVAVSVAVVWTAGIFACFHRPVDIVGSTMPATLLVYGVVNPIFVLTRFMQKLEGGCPQQEAIVQAQSELALPCFLTSLTTLLGFLSFGTASLPTVAVYGVTVAIGVGLAWVTTVTVLPLLLSLMPLPRRRLSNLGSARWLDTRLIGLWTGVRRGGRWVLVAAGSVLVLGSAIAYKQRISSVYVGNLPRGQTVDAIHTLERKLSGIIRTVVYFEGEAGSMKRPEVLRAIAAIDNYAETKSYVNTSLSLPDLVADANRAFHGGDPGELGLPATATLAGQYLALVDPDDRGDFVDASYARSHIRILSDDPGSETFRHLRTELEREIERQPLQRLGIRASLTGTSMVGYVALDDVVKDLLVGFVIGFIVIVALTAILFRSLRIGLMSVVPNLLPVVASFVCIRLLGISLRMDTCLFLSVSIGGLFNTTIHLVQRVRQRVAAGESNPDAVMEDAVRSIGPPALYTAAILSLGFASFMLSGFPGLRVFGMLSMVTLLVGFFSDMIVTSAQMRRFFAWPRVRDEKSPCDQPARSAPAAQ